MSRRNGLLISLRRRAGLSAGGLALFIVQFLVAPMAHLAHHQDDHTHGPDGHVHPLTPAPGTSRVSLRARLLLWRAQHDAEHARLHAQGAAHTHGGPADLQIDPRTWSHTRLADDGHQSAPDPRHGHGAAGHFGVTLLRVG